MDKNDIFYISPITDFGFKKCFRDEIVMKYFLIALFDSVGIELKIENITYLNNESDSDKKEGHRIIYDIKCKLPNTVSVNWPNLQAVNVTPYVSGGFYQGGYNGYYGGGVPGFGGYNF